MREDEMLGWHHGLNGHEFEQAPGDGEGQGSLACCRPWGRKESDLTEQLNNNILTLNRMSFYDFFFYQLELSNYQWASLVGSELPITRSVQK